MPGTTTATRFRLDYVKTIGGGRKIRPYDMAISSDCNFYVLNHIAGFGAGRFTVCNMDEDVIEELPDNAGDGPFGAPASIAFDREERMSVIDEGKHRVTIIDKQADFLGEWGKKGSGDGELDSPSALRFDKNDDCYVVDQMNHRVQKFTKDGEFLRKWGEFGDGHGQFNMPWGLNLDSQDNVYVADWRNDRVQKFTPDGDFIATFGESGRDDGQLDRPSCVVIDEEGYIYIGDWGNERVQVLDPDGDFVTKLLGQATLSVWASRFIDSNPDEKRTREASDLYPDLPPELSAPFHVSSQTEPYFFGITSLQIDDEGRLYVIESRRQRFQVYQKRSVSSPLQRSVSPPLHGD